MVQKEGEKKQIVSGTRPHQAIMVCQTSWMSTVEIMRPEVSAGVGLLRETLNQFDLLILLQVSIYTGLKGPMLLDRTVQELLVRAQEEERRAIIF